MIMTTSNENIYTREPIGFHGTIPLFSHSDDYTENYEKISGDHLQSLRTTGRNPFIDERLWIETEASTTELVRKYSREGDRIVDVGVGLGRVLSEFPHLRRYGVDISLGYLQEAQAKGIETAYALVGDLPYADAAFDLVLCTDVLEHVFDLYGSCANLLRIVRPGGVLIVRVPYREDLTEYLNSPYKFVHLRNFDEPSLRLLFGTIFGVEVIEVTKAGHVPSPTRRIRPLLPHWVVFKFLALVYRLNRKAFRWLVQRWYRPVEINVVVRKPN